MVLPVIQGQMHVVKQPLERFSVMGHVALLPQELQLLLVLPTVRHVLQQQMHVVRQTQERFNVMDIVVSDNQQTLWGMVMHAQVQRTVVVVPTQER
jgi:hypothetical protein